jgi:hypothetical protein
MATDTIDEHAKSRIISRLDQLTPDSKALWGKMNVTQMLTHLNDAFRVCLGMKDAKDRSNILMKYIVFPIATYVLPFSKGLATAPELNQHKGGTKARDFYTEREFLKKMIDIFNEREPSKIKRHTFFGDINKQQWAHLFVKHFDHHLRQFGV